MNCPPKPSFSLTSELDSVIRALATDSCQPLMRKLIISVSVLTVLSVHSKDGISLYPVKVFYARSVFGIFCNAIESV